MSNFPWWEVIIVPPQCSALGVSGVTLSEPRQQTLTLQVYLPNITWKLVSHVSAFTDKGKKKHRKL